MSQHARGLAGRGASRRTVLILPVLLGAVLTTPAPAHAETLPAVASMAVRVGESSLPPVGRALVVLPDGDLLIAGSVEAATRLGGISLGERGAEGFLTRLSADGTQTRWATALRDRLPTSLALVGETVVALGAEAANPYSAHLAGLDTLTGTVRWNRKIHATRFCARPELVEHGDDGVLVVGSYAGSIVLSDGTREPAERCRGFLSAYDAVTAEGRAGMTFGGAGDVIPQHAATSRDGHLVVAGVFSEDVALGQAALPSDGRTGRAFVARLAPDWSPTWLRPLEPRCAGCAARIGQVLATDDDVFLYSTGHLMPPEPWMPEASVAHLDARNGTRRWEQRVHGMNDFDGRAPQLALRMDGTLLVATAQQDPQYFPSRGGLDTALIGFGPGGSWAFVDEISGPQDDTVSGLVTDGASVLAIGTFDATDHDGRLVRSATVARYPSVPHLEVLASSSGDSVGSWLPFVAVSDASTPISYETSGPCTARSTGNGVASVRLDHVGTCEVTVAQSLVAEGPLATVRKTLAIKPFKPMFEGGLMPSLVWPQPVPEDFGLRFMAPHDRSPVAGTVTYSIPPGTALPVGAHEITAHFHSADPDASDTTLAWTLMVVRATPRLVVQAPSSIVYGTSFMPDVSAYGVHGELLSGRVTTSVPADTLLDAGRHDLSVGFTPDDPSYRSVAQPHSITVTQASTATEAWLETASSRVVASLRDVSNARPLGGQQVTFSFRGGFCTATTDATGTATCDLSAAELAAAVTTGVSAVYPGSRNYRGSSASVAGALAG